ncbi:hypothetical protein M8C21_030423 [Ambrosia artemisiifolia]|uniref:Uncharacterized protein n=1 Tax=Ambrosia artemisiifolia TaxID=4212 RepID=A0AAD5BVQ5_AMBAR|nr:hypothetical protein M8C21_030423 [Ambrosia artemisiifolia]
MLCGFYSGISRTGSQVIYCF